MSKVVVEVGSSPRILLNVPLKRHIGTLPRIFLLSPCKCSRLQIIKIMLPLQFMLMVILCNCGGQSVDQLNCPTLNPWIWGAIMDCTGRRKALAMNAYNSAVQHIQQ